MLRHTVCVGKLAELLIHAFLFVLFAVLLKLHNEKCFLLRLGPTETLAMTSL